MLFLSRSLFSSKNNLSPICSRPACLLYTSCFTHAFCLHIAVHFSLFQNIHNPNRQTASITVIKSLSNLEADTANPYAFNNSNEVSAPEAVKTVFSPTVPFSLANTYGGIAVSYTHLDVYKRQVPRPRKLLNRHGQAFHRIRALRLQDNV